MTKKSDDMVSLEPFRMWLLWRLQALDGGIKELAREAFVDEQQMGRWVRGYVFDDEIGPGWAGCYPRAIHSVHLTSVDRVGIALGDPGLANRLYPPKEQNG